MSPYLRAGCCSSVSAICLRSPHSRSPAQTHPASAGGGRDKPSLSHPSDLQQSDQDQFLPLTFIHNKRTSAQCENIRILSLHVHLKHYNRSVHVAILQGYMWLSIVPISKDNIPILAKYNAWVCSILELARLYCAKLPLKEGQNNNFIKKMPLTECIFLVNNNRQGIWVS